MEIISDPQNTKFNQKQKFNQIDKNIRITPPPLLLHDKLLELPPEVLLASVPVLEDVCHHGLVILADPHAGWEDEGLARGIFCKEIQRLWMEKKAFGAVNS